LHAVGDGAPWIAGQLKVQFGARGTYPVDFYHLCEYLASAASLCAADATTWLEEQKDRLKANGREGAGRRQRRSRQGVWPLSPPPLGPTRLSGALERGLPIGSGEIESAHRYIIQDRLKRPGAWWAPAHVETMLALRLTRANRQWEHYWQGVEKTSRMIPIHSDAAL
jgi:hypothetical protein